MNPPARVYVVDDDHGILTAFRRLLESAQYEVATYDSPTAFLEHHDVAVPGCVLLDVGMAELSGLEAQQKLLALGATRPIIFVTGFDDVRISVQAMKSGASDYLIKPVPDTVLIAAVEAAVERDSQAFEGRMHIAKLAQQWQSLTAREREVMTQVIRGRLNKQIANDLNIVEKTVKVHRARIMEKMGVRSVAGLVHIAEQLLHAGWKDFSCLDHR
jgi:FixJ family two-component response regulator